MMKYKSLNSLDFDKPETIKSLIQELSPKELSLKELSQQVELLPEHISNKIEDNHSMDRIYKLVKFFEKRSDLVNVLKYIIKYKNVEEYVSISSSKMVIQFFYIILNYYAKHDFDVSYNNTNINNDVKIKIIEKLLILKNNDKALKIYNLLDFMFNEIKDILIEIKNGFWILNDCVNDDFKNKKKCGDLQINNTLNYENILFPELDILFYIIFMFMFPKELKIELKKDLRITDCEYNILEKCKDLIIKNHSVCAISKNICPNQMSSQMTSQMSSQMSSPMSSPPIASPIPIPISINSQVIPTSFLSKIFKKEEKEYIELNSVYGILMLISIFTKLRPFNNRRVSKI